MLFCPLVVYLFFSVIHGKQRAIISSVVDKTSPLYNEKYQIPIIYALLTFGYFVFWIGLRTNFADTIEYINFFKWMDPDFGTALTQVSENTIGEKSPGFYYFTAFFKSFISTNFQWWLMLIAIVCGFCVMYVLWKKSCNFFYSAYLFMALQTFMWMMNGMRQFIAVSILFFVCDWIKEGKIIPYLILTCILASCHSTCIMMIPIYFVARCKPWSSRIVAFMGAIILISIFAEPFFGSVDSALQGTAYSGFQTAIVSGTGVNPIRVAFFAIPPVIAFMYRETLKPAMEEDKFFSICINMSVVTFALYFVAMFTSGMLIGRLPIYTEVYNLLLIPLLLEKCFEGKQKRIAYVVATALFFLYFFLQMNGSRYVSDITGWITH